MTFQDLILVYWVNEEDPACKTSFTKEFTDFADLLMKSRYWYPVVGGTGNNNRLRLIDTVLDISSDVREWCNQTQYSRPFGQFPTVYFGFQGGPGWTLPEFHDILSAVNTIPVKFPGVVTSWLPDNWFDHPGLTPNLTSGENALQWMEQQATTAEPEKIIYEFKGVHHEQGPPPF